MRLTTILQCLACIAWSLVPSPLLADTNVVRVFAAASLKEALDDAAAYFSQNEDVEVSISYAGSSTLARQIASGAPADMFVSANVAWMDELQSGLLIAPDTRVDLVSNQLVIIGSAESNADFKLQEANVVAALESGPLAMALVDAVPAGIYGKQALRSLGLWDAVKSKVAQTDNVRAALALVSLGAAPLGIVYATDAQADPTVRIRAVFPPDSHDPIRYPAALTKQANTKFAKAFLDYLQSDAAHKIFMQHGFSVP